MIFCGYMQIIWNLNLSIIKFYWETASLIHFCIVCGRCSITKAELQQIRYGLQNWKYLPLLLYNKFAST